MRLTDADAWRIIAASHTGILTTVRKDGTPMSLPTWFVVDDRRILSRALITSGRVRRIDRNPQAAFLVESGLAWAELRAVHLTGRLVVDTSAEELERVTRELDEKYSGFKTDVADMPERAQRHYETGRVVLRFEPDDRIISWDNSRLRR